MCEIKLVISPRRLYWLSSVYRGRSLLKEAGRVLTAATSPTAANELQKANYIKRTFSWSCRQCLVETVSTRYYIVYTKLLYQLSPGASVRRQQTNGGQTTGRVVVLGELDPVRIVSTGILLPRQLRQTCRIIDMPCVIAVLGGSAKIARTIWRKIETIRKEIWNNVSNAANSPSVSKCDRAWSLLGQTIIRMQKSFERVLRKRMREIRSCNSMPPFWLFWKFPSRNSDLEVLYWTF